MKTEHQPEITALLERVRMWPVEDRLALLRGLLATLTAEGAAERATTPRPSFERAVGIARGVGPPPTDEQVKQWIDEERVRKYG